MANTSGNADKQQSNSGRETGGNADRTASNSVVKQRKNNGQPKKNTVNIGLVSM